MCSWYVIIILKYNIARENGNFKHIKDDQDGPLQRGYNNNKIKCNEKSYSNRHVAKIERF